MNASRVKIETVLPNPSNPRIIKDDKFKKLVKSIQEFPQMLDLRPIVVDANMVVLGGNMRLKACKAAGLKEVPIVIADNLTEEQQAEFIIKDNVGFGEWDWDLLANEWDEQLLQDWGLQLPFFGHEANNMTEEELNLEEEFDPVGVASGLQRVVFLFDGEEEAVSYLKSINVEFQKKTYAWQVNLSTRSI